MAQFPQLPIHVQRWLSELSDLTLEEHGVYFLTVMQMWMQPDCGMPVDPEWLRKKLRVHPKKWRRLWPVIRSFMTEINGRLYQKTLSEERVYCSQKSSKASRNANKRWETFRANFLKINGTGDAREHNSSNAPTPTPTPTKKESSAADAAKIDSEKVPNGHDWEAQYFRFGKDLLGKNAGGLLAKLLKARGSAPKALAILHVATEKENPREYIGAVIRGANGEDDRRSSIG